MRRCSRLGSACSHSYVFIFHPPSLFACDTASQVRLMNVKAVKKLILKNLAKVRDD